MPTGYRWTFAVVALLLAGVLAGCSTDDEPVLLANSGTTGSTQTGETTATEAEGNTADLGAGYTVVAEAAVSRITARSGPDPDADIIAEFANPTPVGGPLVFRAVDGTLDDPEGAGRWMEVDLPVQPNGTRGWIDRDEVTLSNNPYRVEISRSDFTLQVYELGNLWLETTVGIGTGDTPTPVGDFYLKELLAPPDPTGPYGPYAFGLSGYSETLENFGGADTAVIGLHGTNQPEALGTNVSSGCIRLDNAIIEQLAQTLPLGTPVLIS